MFLNDRSKQSSAPGADDLKSLVRAVLEEFVSVQSQRNEPAYKAELDDERRKRESLERRLNELADENRRSRVRAESLESEAQIKRELQKHGVSKLDLAYRILRDDIQRSEDGALVVRQGDKTVPYAEHVVKFLEENPELLPARNLSGSGVTSSLAIHKTAPEIDIDSIRPGMTSEEMAKVREAISRVANEFQ